MTKSEIKVGGHYTAKVNNRIVTVRVDRIQAASRPFGYSGKMTMPNVYHVTNLATGRTTTFRSAAKFRGAVPANWTNATLGEDKQGSDPSLASGAANIPSTTSSDTAPPAPKTSSDLCLGYDPSLVSGLCRCKTCKDKPRELRTGYAGGKKSSDPTPRPVASIAEVRTTPSTTPTSATSATSAVATRPTTGFAAKLAERPANTDTSPHVEVPALAGTGKTTTIMGGVCSTKGQPMDLTPSPQQQAVWDAMALGKNDTIRISAFNTKITDVLKDRVAQMGLDKKGVEARGIHSLGNGACFKAFGRIKAESYAVTDLIAHVLGVSRWDAKKDPKLNAMIEATSDLVSYCKQTLSDPTPDAIDNLASRYDVEMNGSREQIYDLVPDILNRCRDPHSHPGRLMHFDDMVWLPLIHSLPIPKVDNQIVDESQDLNRMQQELMYRVGHRIFFVGDENQAIYGFAGADADSMNNMRKHLTESARGCLSLPLTMTRRCGRAIVREAQRYVPNFEAHESNSEGLVGKLALDKNLPNAYHSRAQDGDFVLCRCNAPLVSECFKLLAMGRKANILGRKIGEGLIALIDKSKKSSTPELITWLGDWLSREQANEAAKRYPSEGRIENLQDRHDCIVTFCSGLGSVSEVRAKINSIFTDNKQMRGVTFSSIHKSKGLEANRVFFLQPKGVGPRRDKMQKWELVQEDNLSYVAITRAIQELYYVS